MIIHFYESERLKKQKKNSMIIFDYFCVKIKQTYSAAKKRKTDNGSQVNEHLVGSIDQGTSSSR